MEELKELSPDDAELFEENKQDYFAKLDELSEEAAKLKSIPSDQRVLVTAHDAFGYFGRMHDMEVVGLQGLSTEDEIGLSDIRAVSICSLSGRSRLCSLKARYQRIDPICHRRRGSARG